MPLKNAYLRKCPFCSPPSRIFSCFISSVIYAPCGEPLGPRLLGCALTVGQCPESVPAASCFDAFFSRTRNTMDILPVVKLFQEVVSNCSKDHRVSLNSSQWPNPPDQVSYFDKNNQCINLCKNYINLYVRCFFSDCHGPSQLPIPLVKSSREKSRRMMNLKIFAFDMCQIMCLRVGLHWKHPKKSFR